MDELRKIAEAASGRHDPCAMCDGGGPWDGPWGVVDDVKGDGHWDNEFHVLTEGGEGSALATFEYRPHAEHFATFDPPTVLALLGVVEAAEARMRPGARPSAGAYEREDDALREALARFRQAHGQEHG